MLTHIFRSLGQFTLGRFFPHPLRNSVTIFYRCWPIDMDLFMHMNNSAYVRVAEYSRWRFSPQLLFSEKENKIRGNYLFLVTANDAVYKKSIQGMTKYAITTTLSTSDDKWLKYKHIFHKGKTEDADRIVDEDIYCIVNTTAVFKEKSGKTFRPSELRELNEFNKALFR